MARVLMLTRGGDGFGTGHCYRTRWLAKALIEQPWVDDGRIACVGSNGEFWERSDWPMSILGSPEDGLAMAERPDFDLVVVDWLDSSPDAIAMLASRKRIVLLDDYGPASGQAQLVINSLLAPLEARQAASSTGIIISGAQFVQLNPDVVKLRRVAEATTRAMATELVSEPYQSPFSSLLLSLSGQNSLLLNELIEDMVEIEDLWEIDFDFIPKVIVMPAPADVVTWHSSRKLELLPREDCFPDIMAACDLVVCHDGLTLWEAAYLGIPSIVVPLWSTGKTLERAGCCVTVEGAAAPGDIAWNISELIRVLAGDSDRRGRMSAAGMRLLDGRGLQRTVDAIGELVTR